MDNKMLLAFMAKKGQFGSASWSKKLKTKKGIVDIVEKIVKCKSVRIGVEYDRMKTVIEKRDTGELPAENAGLPWGRWHLFPHIIAHKPKGAHEDSFYLRFSCSANTKFETLFLLNGLPATREQVEKLCPKSEFPEKEETPDVFNVKLDNMLEIV